MNDKLWNVRPSMFGLWGGLVLYPAFGLIQGAQAGVKVGMWVVMSTFPAGAWYGWAALVTKNVFMFAGMLLALILLMGACAAAWWTAVRLITRLTEQRGVEEPSYAEVD